MHQTGHVPVSGERNAAVVGCKLERYLSVMLFRRIFGFDISCSAPLVFVLSAGAEDKRRRLKLC